MTFPKCPTSSKSFGIHFSTKPSYFRWKNTMGHYGSSRIVWLDGLLEFP
jgi:hypothetical protein